jgi:hypothetical protein
MYPDDRAYTEYKSQKQRSMTFYPDRSSAGRKRVLFKSPLSVSGPAAESEMLCYNNPSAPPIDRAPEFLVYFRFKRRIINEKKA